MSVRTLLGAHMFAHNQSHLQLCLQGIHSVRLHFIILRFSFYDSYFSVRSTTHGFVTGAHWRCSDVEEAGWLSSWFDDSSWSNAFPSPDEGSAAYTSGFPDEAQLIWHFDAENVDTVYCRARMCPGLFFFSCSLCILNF